MYEWRSPSSWARLIAFVTVAWGLLGPIKAAAQVSPETVARLQALDEQLRSENQYVRIAALESALKDDRLLFQKHAYKAAFGGKDMEMQALALRYTVRKGRTYPIRLMPTEERKVRDYAKELRGATLYVREYNPDSGQITVDVAGVTHNMSGTINGNRLDVGRAGCSVSLQVAGASFLRGVLGCGQKPQMPVQMPLD